MADPITLPLSEGEQQPLTCIIAAVRERVRATSIEAVSQSSGITRQMLWALLNGKQPGRDTLALLFAWDESLDKPVFGALVTSYLSLRGQRLRTLRREGEEPAEAAA